MVVVVEMAESRLNGGNKMADINGVLCVPEYIGVKEGARIGYYASLVFILLFWLK